MPLPTSDNPQAEINKMGGTYADPVDKVPVEQRTLQTPKGEDKKPFTIKGGTP